MIRRREKMKTERGYLRHCLVFPLLIISLSFVPLQSFALYFVNDLGANVKLLQELKSAAKRYSELQKQYSNMEKRLHTVQSIQKDAEGHYGYGSLLNGAKDLEDREWSPDSWHDTLKGLSGGNKARYQQLLSQYKQSNKTLSQSDYTKGSSTENAKVYQQQVQTNTAATVNASYAFNNIKTHLNNLHELSAKIENTKNEKAATDLNTRMQAEMAYVEVQILKQTALLNEQLARSDSDKIASETAAAKFNALPK